MKTKAPQLSACKEKMTKNPREKKRKEKIKLKKYIYSIQYMAPV